MPGPSGTQLATTTMMALIVAAIILVTIVLPAEYAIDPLGTGDALGLTAMSKPVLRKPELLPANSELKPATDGPISKYAAPSKTDAVVFTIGPYDYVEYKYQLLEGAQMTFSWKASEPVINDFHGEVDADPNKEQSFDKDNWQEAHGLFTAPFSGIHGWYWENPTGHPITVTLHTTGFYALAIEFRSDKTQVKHELKAP